MKIFLSIFYSLLFASIICIDKKTEDISSDLGSAMLKGIYHAGDAIVTGVKGVKEISKIIGKVGDSAVNTAKKIGTVYMAKTDAIANVAATKRMFPNAALKGYSMLSDKTLYYKTLEKLDESKLIEAATKAVNENPYLYIFKIKPITKTKFFDNTLGEAGKFLVGETKDFIKALPYISSVLNGYEAGKRFMNGEIVGGSLKLVESAVSLIPGVSFVPSILPSVASLIYDCAK